MFCPIIRELEKKDYDRYIHCETSRPITYVWEPAYTLIVAFIHMDTHNNTYSQRTLNMLRFLGDCVKEPSQRLVPFRVDDLFRKIQDDTDE